MNKRSLQPFAIFVGMVSFTGILCLLLYCLGYNPPRAEGALVNEHGWMTAHIRLEGRQNHSGVLVSVDGWQKVTGGDGRVFFPLPNGHHTITVTMNGYLYAQRCFEIRNNRPIDLSTVTLMAGDADGNRLIDLFDLFIVRSAFGSSPPSDSRADINGDYKVDIMDALLVGANLGEEAPSLWPGGWAFPVGSQDSAPGLRSHRSAS